MIRSEADLDFKVNIKVAQAPPLGVILLSSWLLQFFTDLSMLVPSIQLSRHVWAAGRPVYHYTFAHHSRSTMPAWFGSYHEVELNYIFGAPFLGLNVDGAAELNYTEEDRQVSAAIMVLWSNFAKTG